jgi:hypothetical protein
MVVCATVPAPEAKMYAVPVSPVPTILTPARPPCARTLTFRSSVPPTLIKRPSVVATYRINLSRPARRAPVRNPPSRQRRALFLRQLAETSAVAASVGSSCTKDVTRNRAARQ